MDLHLAGVHSAAHLSFLVHSSRHSQLASHCSLVSSLLPAGLVPRETRARSLRDARASRGLASTLRHPLGRSIRDERITKEAHAHARRTNMQKTARNNHALSPHRHVLCKRYLSELARGRPALPQAGYDFITVGGGLPGLQGFFTFQWFLSCAAHSLYTEWREYTTHTNTTPQHAASQACLLHDGDVLTQGSVCVLLLPPAWSRQ